jgi:hypothetical protein
MQNFETLHDYLAAHSDEIGERILSSYPALFGAQEIPSPLLSQMLRSPLLGPKVVNIFFFATLSA